MRRMRALGKRLRRARRKGVATITSPMRPMYRHVIRSIGAVPRSTLTGRLYQAEPGPGPAREDGRQVLEAEMLGRRLAGDGAEVGGHLEVAALEARGGVQAGPFAQDAAALDPSAEDHHHARVAVVGAAVAVLLDRAPELGHRENDDVVGLRAQVLVERRDRAAELLEALGELAVRAALVEVVVPAAGLDEADARAEAGLEDARQLEQV